MNRERKIMLIILAALLIVVVGTIIVLNLQRAPVADPLLTDGLQVTATPTQPVIPEQGEHDENALGEQAISEEGGESESYGELVVNEVPAAAPID